MLRSPEGAVSGSLGSPRPAQSADDAPDLCFPDKETCPDRASCCFCFAFCRMSCPFSCFKCLGGSLPSLTSRLLCPVARLQRPIVSFICLDVCLQRHIVSFICLVARLQRLTVSFICPDVSLQCLTVSFICPVACLQRPIVSFICPVACLQRPIVSFTCPVARLQRPIVNFICPDVRVQCPLCNMAKRHVAPKKWKQKQRRGDGSTFFHP